MHKSFDYVSDYELQSACKDAPCVAPSNQAVSASTCTQHARHKPGTQSTGLGYNFVRGSRIWRICLHVVRVPGLGLYRCSRVLHRVTIEICPIHTADADATKLFCGVASGVGGVYMNSQLAHDDCRRIRSTIWMKLAKQTVSVSVSVSV